MGNHHAHVLGKNLYVLLLYLKSSILAFVVMDSGTVTFGLIYRIWDQSAECPAFNQKPRGESHKPVDRNDSSTFSDS